jgi:hypothetical protein
MTFSVIQVTHRVSDNPEMWLAVGSIEHGQTKLYRHDEEELEEDAADMKADGWVVLSDKRREGAFDSTASVWNAVAAEHRRLTTGCS